MEPMQNKVRFSYVQPTEEQVVTMQNFRDKFQVLYDEMNTLERNRGIATALTKFEESNMWLNKGITGNC